MASLSAIFVFTSAVRGFHIYKKSWRPTKGQLLNCSNETGNVFDPYTIKVCEFNSEKIVGHLPREISRITKFILDRGTHGNCETYFGTLS